MPSPCKIACEASKRTKLCFENAFRCRFALRQAPGHQIWYREIYAPVGQGRVRLLNNFKMTRVVPMALIATILKEMYLNGVVALFFWYCPSCVVVN